MICLAAEFRRRRVEAQCGWRGRIRVQEGRDVVSATAIRKQMGGGGEGITPSFAPNRSSNDGTLRQRD